MKFQIIADLYYLRPACGGSRSGIRTRYNGLLDEELGSLEDEGGADAEADALANLSTYYRNEELHVGGLPGAIRGDHVGNRSRHPRPLPLQRRR